MMRDWGGQKVSWVNRKLEFEWTCFVSTNEKTTLCWWSKRGISLMLLPLLGYFVFFSFLAAAIEEKITKNRKLHCQRHHGAESDYLDDIRIWVLKALRKYWHVSVKTQVFWQPCQNGKMAGFKATLRSTWIFNRVLRRNNISHRRSFLQVIVCIIERVSICVKLRKWACILLWQGAPTVRTAIRMSNIFLQYIGERGRKFVTTRWIIFRILTCCRFEWALFSVRWNLNGTWHKKTENMKVCFVEIRIDM